MSKNKSLVSAYCSISNYLKAEDPEFYRLLEELCLLRMLTPDRRTKGITLLRPDAGLLKKLMAEAHENTNVELVNKIKRMVIVQHMPKVSDFADGDVPAYSREVLKVKSATGAKVEFENGSTAVPDKGFKNREDREGMAVYVLSGEDVPSGNGVYDAKSLKATVKGGADFAVNHTPLFEMVLNACCANRNNDAALEMLVTLYAVSNENERLAILSQLGNDTLGALAILLRPYSNNKQLYISDGTLNQLERMKSRTVPNFTYVKDPLSVYNKMLDKAANVFSDLRSKVCEKSKAMCEHLNKVEGLQMLRKAMVGLRDGLPANIQGRRTVEPMVMLAEAELRVAHALLRDNGLDDAASLRHLFTTHKLDQPYMLDDNFSKDANVGIYFSTVHLIGRSTALFHLPKLGGAHLEDIPVMNRFICLDAEFELCSQTLSNTDNALEDAVKNGLADL